MLNPDGGILTVSARFYDLAQRGYGITYTDNGQATVQLPEQTRMVIDVGGGRMPFTATAIVHRVSNPNVTELDIDLASVTQRIIDLHATDSSDPVKNTQLLITASHKGQSAAAPAGTRPKLARSG
jgi:hypothetical protein